MKKISEDRGFTLIELIVVIALVGIIMVAAFPRFQRALIDPTRSVSQWILWQVPGLKQKAATENRRYALHVDFERNQFFITHEAMPPEEIEVAKKGGYKLPAGIDLTSVEFPENRWVRSETASIHFYRQGYSDRAILHLKADNHAISYFIEPFLPDVKVVNAHAGYRDR